MYKKSLFENKVRFLTEELPHVRSVCLGIWVNTGARHEDKRINGISHFIEHMLFKGTKRRTALDIAKEMDSVGGVLNAFTNREYTCYYVKVLENHLPLAVDLLSDIFLNSTLDSTELERERKVILQEISMVDDTPDDFIHDFFNDRVWPDNPLGRPILGTNDTIGALTRDDMLDYMRARYVPGEVIITASGALNHDSLAKMLGEKGFGSMREAVVSATSGTPDFEPGISVVTRELEQVHMVMGARSLGQKDPRRYEGFVLNTVLGGGMSSRLFQEIREKRGLAYSVYSYLNSYSDTGSLAVYVGTGKEQYKEVAGLVIDELRKVRDILIDGDELKSAREQIKGNLILGLESTDSWMTKLAKNEIFFGRDIPLDEVMAGIDAVTSEGVRRLAQDILVDGSLAMALVGGVDSEEVADDILKI